MGKRKSLIDTDTYESHVCKSRYTKRGEKDACITYDWVLIECEFRNQKGSIECNCIRIIIDNNSHFMYTNFILALISFIGLVLLSCVSIFMPGVRAMASSTQTLVTCNFNFKRKQSSIRKCKTIAKLMITIYYVLIRWFEQIDHYYR